MSEYKAKDYLTHIQTSEKTLHDTSYIWSKMMKDTKKRMNPSQESLDAYAKFLNMTYIMLSKKELNVSQRKYLGKARGGNVDSQKTYAGVGYATGGLKDSIFSQTKITTRRDFESGSVYIGFELTPEFKGYGEYIAKGRKAAKIPVSALLTWIRTKVNNGVMTLYDGWLNKNRGTGKKRRENTEENFVLGIAIAISRKADKMAKPPVLKDWYSLPLNQRLRLRFNEETKKAGRIYRARIRKSIMTNLNIKYGKKSS